MAIIPMTPDARVGVISVYDPAIDHEKSEKKEVVGIDTAVLAYWRDRFTKPASWRESVKFSDGERPTVFVVGVIPPSVLSQIEDECMVGKDNERRREMYWRCFLHCLRDIENGPTETIKKDGRAIEQVPKKQVEGIDYVDPKWLASVFVRGLRDVAIDIGLLAYSWNQMQDSDIKN